LKFGQRNVDNRRVQNLLQSIHCVELSIRISLGVSRGNTGDFCEVFHFSAISGRRLVLVYCFLLLLLVKKHLCMYSLPAFPKY
jgi:hypothetical protein